MTITKKELVSIYKFCKIPYKTTSTKVSLEKNFIDILNRKTSTKKNTRRGTQKGSGNCEKGYTFQKIIGAGTYGKIFIACMSDVNTANACHYVAKVQLFTGNDNYDFEFKNELGIYSYLRTVEGYEKYVPKLYDAYMCTYDKSDSKLYTTLDDEGNKTPSNFECGIMILEKMDGDMESLLYDEEPSIEVIAQWLIKIRNALNIFKQFNILHNDLTPRNILYTKSEEGIYDFYITDFGWTKKYFLENPSLKKYDDDFGVDFYQLWTMPHKFFKDFDITCLIFFIISSYYDYDDILQLFLHLGETGKEIYENSKMFRDMYMIDEKKLIDRDHSENISKELFKILDGSLNSVRGVKKRKVHKVTPKRGIFAY